MEKTKTMSVQVLMTRLPLWSPLKRSVSPLRMPLVMCSLRMCSFDDVPFPGVLHRGRRIANRSKHPAVLCFGCRAARAKAVTLVVLTKCRVTRAKAVTLVVLTKCRVTRVKAATVVVLTRCRVTRAKAASCYVDQKESNAC